MNGFEPPISDEAVRQKTGNDWNEWFAILDAARAQSMTHKQIVAFLVEKHAIGTWLQQMVTVTYEQARGLRQKHEMLSGYQISRSRTIVAPVERVYAALLDSVKRAGWLSDSEITIRKASPKKPCISLGWMENQSECEFYRQIS